MVFTKGKEALRTSRLFDGNFGTANAFAAEGAYFAAGHFDDAVFCGMDGEVAADSRPFTGALGKADLADDDLADFDGLAAIDLNTEALAWTIVNVFD